MAATMEELAQLSLEELQQRFADLRRDMWRAPSEQGRDMMIECTRVELTIGGRKAEMDKLQRPDQEIRAFLANRIRAARGMCAMSQEELARAARLSQPVLSNIEQRERELRVTELIRIAVATGQPLAFFTYPAHRQVRTGWEDALAE